MIHETANQLFEFLYSVGVGVLLGFMFEITKLSNLPKRFKLAFVIVLDLVYFVTASFIYIILCKNTLNMKLNLYILLGNSIGFLIYAKSISILLAKLFKIVYNLIVNKLMEKGKDELRTNRNAIRVGATIGTLLLIGLIVTIIVQFSIKTTLTSREELLTAQLENTDEKISSIEEEIEYRKSAEYIERYMREELGVIKDGETKFV